MIAIKDAETVENLIEEKFCKPFESLKTYPMEAETTEVMIGIMLHDTKPDSIEKEFLYKVITRRIELCFTFKIEDWKLVLFLMFHCKTPGMAIMYITYLQYWCKKNQIKELNFDMFCTRVFPLGFPSRDSLHNLWDSTKVNTDGRSSSDNLVDYPVAAKSIQF